MILKENGRLVLGLLKLLKNCSLILFVLIAAMVPQHAKAKGITMTGQLNHLLNTEPDLQGSIAGISVRSASNGLILYDHLGSTRMRVASNLKLFTAAAALNVLGEDYRFKTEVLANGSIKRKTLNGSLYLKGKGDPTVLKSDLDNLAEKLKMSGISKISGNLVGDDSWYDHVRYSTDLTWMDETTYYGAQISALTLSPDKDYDAGTIIVQVKPNSKIGSKPIVSLTPKTSYVKIINHSITGAADGKRKIKIERGHGSNTVTVSGTIPMKAKSEREWIGVWEPTRYVLALFKQSLSEHGIKVAGKVVTGTTPKAAKKLLTHESMTLSKLLVPFMKLSNNGHAEVLTKEMGRGLKGEGSWEKGLEVINQELPKFGVNPFTMLLKDGSGLSQVNLIPARQISQLLYSSQKKTWFPVYLHSLPVAGISDQMVGGTLRNRMKGPLTKGKVWAKTGTISSVSSLSGYVQTRSGHKLIFSILLNNMLDESKGKQLEEKIVSILANQ
jgi:serine-type D-Ala-D-Ala carboxypeptidase/endopeptidase (penicillin-binding protein 4)